MALLVAEGGTLEVYAANGSLVCQHVLARSTHPACGAAFVNGGADDVVFAAEGSSTVKLLDAHHDRRILAQEAAPSRVISLAASASSRVCAAVALLVDGSVAAVRPSPDRSQLLINSSPATAVWGAGATGFDVSARQCLAVAGSAGRDELFVAAASRSQVALMTVSPVAGQPPRDVGLWSFETTVAAVSAIGLGADGHTAVFVVLASGTVCVRVVAADGSAVSEAVCKLDSNVSQRPVTSAALSRNTLAVSFEGGRALAVVRFTIDAAAGSVQFRQVGVESGETEALAVGLPPRGPQVLLLTYEGVAAVTPRTAPIVPPCDDTLRLTSADIAAASERLLGDFASALEQKIRDAAAQLRAVYDASSVDAASAVVADVRAMTLALLDRERLQRGSVNPDGRTAKMDARVQRLEVAAHALGLWVQGGCEPLPALDAVAATREERIARIRDFFADSLAVDSAPMAAAAERWSNGPYWAPRPCCAELLLRWTSCADVTSAPAAIVSAIERAASVSDDAVALLAMYVAAGAPTPALIAFANRVGVPHSLVHLAFVARAADDDSARYEAGLTTATRGVSSCADGSEAVRELLLHAFTQLVDAFALEAVEPMLATVALLQSRRALLGRLPDAAALRALCLAAHVGDERVLRLLEPNFAAPDARPLWVSAFVLVARQEGTAAPLEATLASRDIDLAAAVLALDANAHDVAAELFISARRFHDALRILDEHNSGTPAEMAIAAHVRQLAVAGPAPLPTSAGPTGDEDDDGAASSDARNSGRVADAVAASAALCQSSANLAPRPCHVGLFRDELAAVPLTAADVAPDDDAGDEDNVGATRQSMWAATLRGQAAESASCCPVTSATAKVRCGHKLPCPYHPPVASHS